MSGSLLQVLTRNPLAEPSVLGVSGGASVGALAVLMLGGAGTIWVAGGAWLGAITVMILLWILVGGFSVHPSRLLLAGVMVATGCGAITTLMIAFASNVAMPGMIHWLMGDLDSVMSLESVGAILGVWLSVLIIVWKLSPKVHLLQLGTDKALTLGVDVSYIQWVMVLLSALSTGAAVSIAGSIGFVGLLQVLTRNPLAEPSVLGVSGGASVGALAVLMLGGAGTIWVAGGAWLGAVTVMILLWVLVGGVS